MQESKLLDRKVNHHSDLERCSDDAARVSTHLRWSWNKLYQCERDEHAFIGHAYIRRGRRKCICLGSTQDIGRQV